MYVLAALFWQLPKKSIPRSEKFRKLWWSVGQLRCIKRDSSISGHVVIWSQGCSPTKATEQWTTTGCIHLQSTDANRAALRLAGKRGFWNYMGLWLHPELSSGKNFKIETDHKPLVPLLSTKTPRWIATPSTMVLTKANEIQLYSHLHPQQKLYCYSRYTVLFTCF